MCSADCRVRVSQRLGELRCLPALEELRRVDSAMAPHLSAKEQDFLRGLIGKGLPPVEIHERLAAKRAKKDMAAPSLPNLRRALKGFTYKKGIKETRGRKKKLTPAKVRAMDTARKSLITKAKGEQEVHWEDIMRKARVLGKVHLSTASRALKEKLPDLKWRAPREKPTLSREHKAERLAVCSEWQSFTPTFFTRKLDMVIDNKKFAIPTHKNAKAHLKMTKVRGHLRTRAEGLESGFTKPNSRKHRSNPGGYVNICAGILNGKVKLWHELPDSWNGCVAEDLYRGPIMTTLAAQRGRKRRYVIMEDNDPVGYKSNRAKAAKEELKIEPLRFPKYSPDLNPMDFYIWSEIERRVLASSVSKVESAKKYKARLRRVALSLPSSAIEKAMAAIRKRAEAVIKAKGGYVVFD